MQRKSVEGVIDAVPERAASSTYDALLHSDLELARETHETLMRAEEEHGLIIHERPLCGVLRPRFLSSRRRDRLTALAEALARLLERIGMDILQSSHLLDLIGASDAERAIWAIEPGFQGLTLTSRLDSFMVDDQPRFIEYNAESPAGIAFCDILLDIFNRLPPVRRWRGPDDPQPLVGRDLLLQTLQDAYREWGGRDTPSVAIIDWRDVLTRRDFELAAAHFQAAGIPCVIADPRNLEYRSGRVWHGNQPVTLVYRRVLLHELLEKAAEADGLLRAYADGAVCVVNSPRSKLLHKKPIFALLSDPDLGLELSPEESALIAETIPWTRIVTTGSTTFRGRRVDLPQLLLDQPDRFAIKPFDDYGGRGVVLGWDTDSDVWAEQVERAVSGSYVAQERVDVPRESFPVWQAGRLDDVEFMLDTDPLLFRNRVGSILTRLSGSALLNVTAGSGSTTATFVLPEEAA